MSVNEMTSLACDTNSAKSHGLPKSLVKSEIILLLSMTASVCQLWFISIPRQCRPNVSDGCMDRDIKRLVVSVIHDPLSATDSTNLALFRPATQSTTYSPRGASRAVDGTLARSWTHPLDSHPWWKVQLAHPVWITHVEITNYRPDENSMFHEICTRNMWLTGLALDTSGPFY